MEIEQSPIVPPPRGRPADLVVAEAPGKSTKAQLEKAIADTEKMVKKTDKWMIEIQNELSGSPDAEKMLADIQKIKTEHLADIQRWKNALEKKMYTRGGRRTRRQGKRRSTRRQRA